MVGIAGTNGIFENQQRQTGRRFRASVRSSGMPLQFHFGESIDGELSKKIIFRRRYPLIPFH